MLKKIIIVLLGITTLTGCGTLMEPARKTITIHSATPSKMYTDRGGYVGEGELVSFKMDNRDGDSGDMVILREIGNEKNIRYVPMERNFNAGAILDIFCWPTIFIDIATGGIHKLSRTTYVVGDYSKEIK